MHIDAALTQLHSIYVAVRNRTMRRWHCEIYSGLALAAVLAMIIFMRLEESLAPFWALTAAALLAICATVAFTSVVVLLLPYHDREGRLTPSEVETVFALAYRNPGVAHSLRRAQQTRGYLTYRHLTVVIERELEAPNV